MEQVGEYKTSALENQMEATYYTSYTSKQSMTELTFISNKYVRRPEVYIQQCSNKEADDVFMQHYWMKRVRRSRRLSYVAFYWGEKVAWIQVADLFGTKLAKPLQPFDIQEIIELCRGYFLDSAPVNIESCAIGKILRLLPNDWYRNFGIKKKLVIVYQDLDARQRGIVYRALSFKPYAYCVRARHYTAPTRGNSIGNKIVWARRLKPVNGQHYRLLMPEPISITLPSIKATNFPRGN